MLTSKFKTVNQLKLHLYLQDYLTSDDFSHPDREYLFLKNDTITLKRIDGIDEPFDFEKFKHLDFRNINNLDKQN